MKAWRAAAAATVWAGACGAAAPQLTDFHAGFTLEGAPGFPVQEVLLPDEVYAGVTRDDLADLRVFNDAGIIVPHALCTEPVPAPDVVREESVAVFTLQRAAVPDVTGSTQVEVQTSGGTAVRIEEPAPASPASAPEVTAYVIDARDVKDPIRALRLAWTADGASEVAVRVESSEDLDRWQTVVPHTTLLRAAAVDDRTLERMRVELPAARYRYLRLERSDGGTPPLVDRVTAEVVAAAPPVEPRRFVPAWLEAPAEAEHVFDTGRRAPVRAARVVLPAENMSVQVALDTRATAEAAWRERWRGEVTSVNGGAGWQPVPHVTDRYWRLRVLRGRETLGAARPSLELGYDPARLRFMAQGRAPYVLAYGSARTAPAEATACGTLLPGGDARLVGAARTLPAVPARFGGRAALEPPPAPTPVRQIILWVVLLAGTALVVVMAFRLLRRLRQSA